MAHEEAENMLELLLRFPSRFRIAPNGGQPFGRRDHVRTADDGGEKSIQFRHVENAFVAVGRSDRVALFVAHSVEQKPIQLVEFFFVEWVSETFLQDED